MGPTPIFVLGMPRSGTTLIKQILSTHAMVLGGGELPTLGQLTDDLSSESMTFPEIVATLDDGDIERIGHEYSNALAEISENTPFAVDKMPPGNSLRGGIEVKHGATPRSTGCLAAEALRFHGIEI